MVNYFLAMAPGQLKYERCVFSKSYWGNWIFTCKRMKLGLYLTLYAKINSKQMRDLDVKPQNYKTPKENIGENDYDFKFSKGFTATNTKNIIHTI